MFRELARFLLVLVANASALFPAPDASVTAAKTMATDGVRNKRWVVARYGEGDFNPNDFRAEETALEPVKDGEVRVEIKYASCDPTQIGWSRADSYMPKIPLGEVMRSSSAGFVTESRSPTLAVGDRVKGLFGFQKFWTGPAEAVQPLSDATSFEDSLGLMAHIGATAWAFVDIGTPKAGETAVVTGAAGAVGSLVVQLAKAKGCKCVGIAGSAAKLEVVKSLGADYALNYKDADFAEQLKAACPNGIDIYFENVGGKITETAWPLLSIKSRVVVCGMIAMYTSGAGLGFGQKPSLPLYNTDIISKRIKIEGFLCSDYVGRWGEIFQELATLREEGKLKMQVDVVEGFDNAIDAVGGLFTGDNTGKRLVKF